MEQASWKDRVGIVAVQRTRPGAVLDKPPLVIIFLAEPGLPEPRILHIAHGWHIDA